MLLFAIVNFVKGQWLVGNLVYLSEDFRMDSLSEKEARYEFANIPVSEYL